MDGVENSGSGMTGKIDTSHFIDAYASIKEMAKSMETVVDNLNNYKADIIENWVGAGRNQFEKSYKVILRKIQDGTDITWDVYENLIKAEERLIQADVDAAKASHTE